MHTPRPGGASPSDATRRQTTATRIDRRLLRSAFLVLGIVGIAIAGWRLALPTAAAQPSRSSGRNPFQTFDLQSATIPRVEIRHGGPPVDGIPSLTNPRFVAAGEATFLQPAERVIGVAIGTSAKAYPLRMLNYHEVVNDQIDDHSFVATYCPLCDSAIVFNRRVGKATLEFGVSGLLYNSNVLMYDRQQPGSMSLWSQVQAAGVAGPYVKTPLTFQPYELATWASWRARYPLTRVLSPETGHTRDYTQSPYDTYFSTPQLMFPVNRQDARLPVKTPILGVWTGRSAVAFSLTDLQRSGSTGEFATTLDGQPLVLHFDPYGPALRVVRAAEGVRWINALWFAWAAFHPETTIYETP
jgi:hypothetical protein